MKDSLDILLDNVSEDVTEYEPEFVAHDALNILRSDVICHHGILGMKWGIRRYQNKDGSLTPEGRARLKIDEFVSGRTEDLSIKKGTDVNRWVSTGRREDLEEALKNPNIPEERKKHIKEMYDEMMSDNKQQKYVSIDGLRTGQGKENGRDFYMSWFTNEGYEPKNGHVNEYKLKKDIKIASAKKVMDAILEETDSNTITNLLKNNKDIWQMTLKYTNDRQFQDKINERFKKAGYDGVEDINDSLTEMPILLFDSNKTIGKAIKTQSGEEALDEYFKRHKQ